MKIFSDYIVYVDESGDHGLRSIDSDHPVFVLAFCIFKKQEYSWKFVPSVQDLKFRFWGHDSIILHSHEIRRSKGDFRILFDQTVRSDFLEAVNLIVSDADFTLIAAAINKTKFMSRLNRRTSHLGTNVYNIALKFCLERLHQHLKDNNEYRRTHVIVESRGRNEDRELALEFRGICRGDNYRKKIMNFDVKFAPKTENCAGIQLADLVAYPIARHVIKPGRENRAHDIVKTKFRRYSEDGIEGVGLKVFP